MAVGRSLTVKLRYRSRPACDMSILPSSSELENHNIRESVMASLPDDVAVQPVMELPTEAMSGPIGHGDPISITIPPSSMIPLTTAAMLSERRKRKHSTSLKRSASTPNVRGHHSGDAGMTLAEKRRNKLGYHRTSVACGRMNASFPSSSTLNVLKGFYRSLPAAQDPVLSCAR